MRCEQGNNVWRENSSRNQKCYGLLRVYYNIDMYGTKTLFEPKTLGNASFWK